MLTKTNTPSLENFWMPFTANRQFKAAPRLLASASGMYYTDTDGNQVLDGTAGLWCCNAGHGRKRITEAVERQISTMDFAPTFQMGHNVAFDFAESSQPSRRVDRMQNSTACSSPIPVRNRSTPHSKSPSPISAPSAKAPAPWCWAAKGYHGVGFGGISVGGLVNNRRVFPQIPADHMRHTLDIEKNAFSKGLPAHGIELADDLERLVQLHGAEKIAAVIVEPMSGSAGVVLPPKGYLERIRATADKYGILLIFDEVITGFGRLGTPFAVDYFGVVPDLVTTAKGLTNGAIPMGAVFAARKVYDGLMTGPENAIELFHGYTYSGHPVAAAAGLATLEVYAEEGLLTRGAGLADHWQEALHSLKGISNIIDIRNLGLVGAIELSSRKDAPGARAYDIFVDCFQKGLLIRVTGDVIALSPPLIVEKEQIDTIVSILGDAIKRAA